MSQVAPLNLRFRSDIQGLRAVAVATVIAFHHNPAWLPGGFIGVDVFFVISGYLMTALLLERKSKDNYSLFPALKSFYLSRLKRIAPAYFVLLIPVSIAAAVFFIREDLKYYASSLTDSLYFNSNTYFAHFGDYFSSEVYEQPLLHTWSLAVEMQFYLLLPFVVLLLPASALKKLLPVAIVVLTVLAEYRLRVGGVLQQETYYALYARIPEFLIGAVVALYSDKLAGAKAKYLAALGMTLILASAALLGRGMLFPGVAAMVPTLGAALVIAGNGSKTSALLSHPLLVWVGAISYSLYLWHWPVLAFLRYYSGSEILSLNQSLFFVVATLLLSCASYYLVEKPLRSKKRKWLVNAATVAVVGSALITGKALANINTWLTPDKLPIEYTRFADWTQICHDEINGDCIQGNRNSAREVLVIGDSHGGMLNQFFDYLGKELDFSARVITSGGCVTITGSDDQRIVPWGDAACRNQTAYADNYLDSSSTIFIAGAWLWELESQQFNEALIKFVETRASQDIIVLSQVPRFNHDPQRARRFAEFGMPVRLAADPEFREANARMAELLKPFPNVRFLNLADLPVFAAAPYFKGDLMYYDRNHLNEVGVQLYALAAEAEIAELLDTLE